MLSGLAVLFPAVLVTAALLERAGGDDRPAGEAAVGAERTTTAPPAPTTDLGADAVARLDTLLGSMTLEQKVGQLFVVYGWGLSATDDRSDVLVNNQAVSGAGTLAGIVERYQPAGIALFSADSDDPTAVPLDNIDTPEQVRTLTAGLQEAATRPGTPQVPLLVAVDQEQGLVNRVGAPATLLPGNMALGAAGSTDAAREAAAITARELLALGINTDFAPVVDVNANPANPVIGVRSFGADPVPVGLLGAAAVEGYQGTGMAATAKHFPGHGDTSVDSHTGLPVITHDRPTLDAVDLLPFRDAIAAGVDLIMTGHLAVPALDPSGDPATLSAPILSGLLRDELGYDGVIITDALDMAAVREMVPDAEVPVRALEAGADLLLMPPDLEVAHAAVLDAVRQGRLTPERIDASVRRVLTLKARRGLLGPGLPALPPLEGALGTPDAATFAAQLADASVTAVRAACDTVPLTPADEVLVVGPGNDLVTAVAEGLVARGVPATAWAVSSDPTSAQVAEVERALDRHTKAVVLTSRAWSNDGQQRLVREALDSGVPTAVVAVRDPWDLAFFPDARTYLATMSPTTVSMGGAVRVLTGEVPPAGRLPVPIPSTSGGPPVLAPIGSGLSSLGCG